MTEQANQSPSGDNRGVAIRRIYLKDVSFEIPNSPAVFTEQMNPQVGIEIETSVAELQEDLYEVVLHVTATAKQEEQVCFLVEVKQAGIFTVSGLDDAQKGSALAVLCPSTLLPYARQIVSDLVLHGGFPPLLLAPISFKQLYEQKMNRLRSEAAAAKSGSH